MNHSFADTYELADCVSTELSPHFFDAALRFYRSQPRVRPEALGEIWHGIYTQCYGELLEVLEKGTGPMLKKVLSQLYDGNFVFGIDYNRRTRGADYIGFWDQTAIAAGVQIGVVPEINPNQPSPLVLSRDELLWMIDDASGINLIVESGPSGLFGFHANGGVVHPKMLEASATVTFLKRLSCRKIESVTELGAGMGWLALACSRMNPAIRYYTVDLPPMAVIQAYFLACCAGEGRVSFGGYTSTFNICGMNWPANSPDFIINQDSLPEMPQIHRDIHLSQIASRVSKGSQFVSINHESSLAEQIRTFLSTQQLEPLKLWLRAPYRARQGYMIEIFGSSPVF